MHLIFTETRCTKLIKSVFQPRWLNYMGVAYSEREGCVWYIWPCWCQHLQLSSEERFQFWLVRGVSMMGCCTPVALIAANILSLQLFKLSLFLSYKEIYTRGCFISPPNITDKLGQHLAKCLLTSIKSLSCSWHFLEKNPLTCPWGPCNCTDEVGGNLKEENMIGPLANPAHDHCDDGQRLIIVMELEIFSHVQGILWTLCKVSWWVEEVVDVGAE